MGLDGAEEYVEDNEAIKSRISVLESVQCVGAVTYVPGNFLSP